MHMSFQPMVAICKKETNIHSKSPIYQPEVDNRHIQTDRLGYFPGLRDLVGLLDPWIHPSLMFESLYPVSTMRLGITVNEIFHKRSPLGHATSIHMSKSLLRYSIVIFILLPLASPQRQLPFPSKHEIHS